LDATGSAVVQDHSDAEYAGVDFRKRFGANLKHIREAAGLSQEELMRLSDVHRTQISKYERGEAEPQAEVLARLSRALGVSAEEFFAGVGWQEEPPRLTITSEA
jgi:transcriptional regulator with XRE-family HTH domain